MSSATEREFEKDDPHWNGLGMRYDATRFLGLALGSVIACSGGVAARGHTFGPDEIRAVLDRQARAGNRLDIATSMDVYER